MWAVSDFVGFGFGFGFWVSFCFRVCFDLFSFAFGVFCCLFDGLLVSGFWWACWDAVIWLGLGIEVWCFRFAIVWCFDSLLFCWAFVICGCGGLFLLFIGLRSMFCCTGLWVTLVVFRVFLFEVLICLVVLGLVLSFRLRLFCLDVCLWF